MKKYKIGFTAGTFDMFHIGHLNLLKAAKSQCDYLIVGVNKDTLVNQYKKKTPLIEQYQRLGIVSSIKFVDEAHLMGSLNKQDAWKKFKFDAVFIGSDYKESDRYKKEELILKDFNVDVVYIPYTIGISSTILAKRIINSELTSEFYKKDIEKVKGVIND